MRAILLAFGFILFLFPFSARASEEDVNGIVSFHIESADPALRSWLSARLGAHGYARSVLAPCADIVVEARRVTTPTADGYIVQVGVVFLSRDGAPIGRWASDRSRGLIKEDRPVRYTALLDRLFDEPSFFMEVAESAVLFVLNHSKSPSRTCGSG